MASGEIPTVGYRASIPWLVAFEPDRYGPDGFPTLTAIYRVTLAPGELRCGDDVSEARWFPEGEIPFRRVAFEHVRREFNKKADRLANAGVDAWLAGPGRAYRPAKPSPDLFD